MSGKLFSDGILRVFAPTGWKCFYGIDSNGKASPKKLHIYKDAQTEFDIFSKAGLAICYYGKDECFLSPKFFMIMLGTWSLLCAAVTNGMAISASVLDIRIRC